MAKGEVRWFNYKKGYGFISQDGQEENDVFVHISAVKASGITKLQEGQKVEYEIKEQKNGKMAAENLKTSELKNLVENNCTIFINQNSVLNMPIYGSIQNYVFNISTYGYKVIKSHGMINPSYVLFNYLSFI